MLYDGGGFPCVDDRVGKWVWMGGRESHGSCEAVTDVGLMLLEWKFHGMLESGFRCLAASDCTRNIKLCWGFQSCQRHRISSHPNGWFNDRDVVAQECAPRLSSQDRQWPPEGNRRDQVALIRNTPSKLPNASLKDLNTLLGPNTSWSPLPRS